MATRFSRVFLGLFMGGSLLPAGSHAEPVETPPVAHQAAGRGGAVASPHPLATEAGLKVLQIGGTALDAAVAVGLTLGVVDSHNSGIGGGCFLLARLADGTLVALDGREMAAGAADRDMYLKSDGSPDTVASKTGPLAPGIPGSLAVYDHLLREHGASMLASHLEAAADLAARGFVIDDKFARRLQGEKEPLARFAGTDSPFFGDGEAVLKAGQHLVQKDLAETYRSIAREGIAWFYGGPFAEKTARWMAAHNGILTRADFANYRIKERQPLRTTYRGYEVVGFPPPSSGGVHVAQILNILEQFDLQDLEEADRIHLVIEAMKLAFADRAHWLGDADFADVPVAGLISEDYAEELAERISFEKAATVAQHGDPPKNSADDVTEKHTAHFTVVDEAGNWVACTATLNTSFGSKVMIPGTGVLLNNQMDDFSIKPGVPNAFGLVGAEANAIAPGKRPLSSMSPTLVLRDGQPVLTAGAAGGPTIITQVLLALVRTLDLKQSLHEALEAPRYHHQWKPDHVLIEKRLRRQVRSALATRGHEIEERSAFGVSQAISFDRRSGLFTAVSEPQAEGAAACLRPVKEK